MTTESTPQSNSGWSRYPHAGQADGVWSMTRDPLPELRDDEVTVRMSHLSVDPGMRGWITPKRSYMPPVQPGEVMRAFGVGEVVEFPLRKIEGWRLGNGFYADVGEPVGEWTSRHSTRISRRPSYSSADWE